MAIDVPTSSSSLWFSGSTTYCLTFSYWPESSPCTPAWRTSPWLSRTIGWGWGGNPSSAYNTQSVQEIFCSPSWWCCSTASASSWTCQCPGCPQAPRCPSTMIFTPSSAVWVWALGATRAVVNSPSLQTLLDDVRSHLWPSISRHILWNIELSEIFSGFLDQSLGVILPIPSWVSDRQNQVSIFKTETETAFIHISTSGKRLWILKSKCQDRDLEYSSLSVETETKTRNICLKVETEIETKTECK